MNRRNIFKGMIGGLAAWWFGGGVVSAGDKPIVCEKDVIDHRLRLYSIAKKCHEVGCHNGVDSAAMEFQSRSNDWIAIGYIKLQEQFAKYRNYSHITVDGIIHHPPKLTPEQRQRLIDSVRFAYVS
jgi:hypothetical protein